jgi:hypothetical protein
MRAAARRRKFRVAHLLRRDGRDVERIFFGVDGGGSAEDERARSTDLRTPRERHARGWETDLDEAAPSLGRDRTRMRS